MLLALPFLTGSVLPLQTEINSHLAKHVSSATTAFISFALVSLALLLMMLAQREMPAITTAAFAGPRVGALLFMVLVIAGQLAMAITLDHFGWAGFREAPITFGKVAGLLLIVAGIWMIRRG